MTESNRRSLDRRAFSKLAGLGALGGGVLAAGQAGKTMAAPARGSGSSTSDKKAWAREHIVGLEHVIGPSFMPGSLALDEAGVRWDMQQLIRGGFTMAFAGPGGLSPPEQVRFIQIVLEEAKGKVLVTAFVGLLPTLEANIKEVQQLERMGVSHVLMSWPPSFLPNTEDQLYAFFRAIADSTKMGVTIYASERFDFARMHPSGVPFGLFDRLVEIPNVVAMKVGFFEQGLNFELFERYSKKVLTNIGCPELVGEFPVLHRLYKPQWGGAGTWNIWQSPEKPYLVDYFNLVMKGQYEKAMKIYWEMYPLHRYGLKNIAHGFGHRFMGDPGLTNYVNWSVGGNGGPIRGGYIIFEDQMEERKRALRAAGIAPRENDEEFWVGRVNYAKGVRRLPLA